MSEALYNPAAYVPNRTAQALAVIGMTYGSDAMRHPDAEANFTLPTGVVNTMLSSPGASTELRELTGAVEGEALVSLFDPMLTSDNRRVAMVRHCAPEGRGGVSEIKTTMRFIVEPVGRLATFAARFGIGKPKSRVHLLAWRGSGLLPEQSAADAS